jgi:hypothetical protein
VLLFLVLTIVATGAALAANAARKSATPTLVATGPTVTVGPGAAPSTVAPTITSTLPGAPAPTITTGPLPTAPGTKTGKGPTPNPVNPNALAVWPAGQSGYTEVLESIPVANGRPAAVARARRAKQAGLRDVGVITSVQYSSLHPGYYVVFAGIYRTASAAATGLADAHAKGFPDAYQTRVTR